MTIYVFIKELQNYKDSKDPLGMADFIRSLDEQELNEIKGFAISLENVMNNELRAKSKLKEMSK